MVQTKNVTFSYSISTSFRFPDIECDAGNALLITGASGKGKTTFLHLLAGILKPSTGSITVGDTNLEDLSNSTLDTFRGRHIGLIFQQSHFVQSLSARENLELAQWLSGSKKDKQKAREMMERLNIAGEEGKNAADLSQGQQQRLSIARALINEPKVILADEPTSSLDDDHCFQVANLLQEQSCKSKAVLIIVTHDQRLKNIFPRHIQLI